MKRLTRWIARFLAALIILLVALMFVALDVVDNRPYLRAPHHTNTVARLEAALAATKADAAPAPVRAGWARVELTPQIGADGDEPAAGKFRAIPLAGYGARQGRPATGVHDKLWVKAVALQVGGKRVVWVGLDSLIVPREVADAAAAELASNPGLKRQEIYLGATHTHGSLGGWGEGPVARMFAGDFQPGARVWMTRCIVDATRSAISNLAPATVASASFRAPDAVRNRLVGAWGRVDDEFSLLGFRQADGASAVIGAFAAHATVLGADNMEFTGDYPGFWASSVEKRTGGLALFIAGAVGSHSPSPGNAGTRFERAESMGDRLAAATVEALAPVQARAEVEFGVAGADVDLPELQMRLTDDLRLRPWLARKLLPVHRATFMQGVRVGNAVWISTPSDYSGELALAAKEHGMSSARRVTVTSFNGDYIGYVIPGKYYHLGGYEPQVMSFHGPSTGDYFEELVRRLVDGL